MIERQFSEGGGQQQAQARQPDADQPITEVDTMTPAADFAMQATVPNFPAELHEAIVVTPAIEEWATTVRPLIQTAYDVARDRERLSLALARGERSWREANGPDNAAKADHLCRMVAYLDLLAAGRSWGGYWGWIDRADWAELSATVTRHTPAASGVTGTESQP